MIFRNARRKSRAFNAFAVDAENPVGEGGNGGERFVRLLAMRRVADAGSTSVSTGQ
jgi:hypothetical protein